MLREGVEQFVTVTGLLVHPFDIANLHNLCHKPGLNRPADQGLPWRYLCGVISVSGKNSSTFNALTSILAAEAPSGALFPLRQEESQMPKLKTKSGAKKRFKVSATGKVMHAQRGKRHGMIKRTKKQIRQLRGTRVLFKTDGDNIKKYFLPND
jgi:large subunit ribosomal protein L35